MRRPILDIVYRNSNENLHTQVGSRLPQLAILVVDTVLRQVQEPQPSHGSLFHKLELASSRKQASQLREELLELRDEPGEFMARDIELP